ncbi:MAG: TetR family transcriptional regulator [Gordonia sp. (in: high G+C Gram-positive bacteria)]|uniref:TetR/AcrR family transcriptional regulator n=1 Tax=Gordonia sp. (in: high G+C Gram-positive bacteria) TaxID=84139 RepID=UPI0039E6CCEF
MDSDRLVDVGVGLIAKVGARALSLTSVARQAGVARATAYRMFGGRDALVSAIVQRELGLMRVKIVEWGADEPDVASRVHRRVVEALRYIREHDALQYVLANEPEVIVGSLVTARDAEGPTLIEMIVEATLEELDDDEAQTLYPDARGGVEMMVRTVYCCMLVPQSALTDDQIANLVVRAVVR